MKLKLLTLLCLVVVIRVNAQDPQYSQFYANKLYLNPAFSGSEEMSRAFLTARYQWPDLYATYFTGTVSFDHYFEKVKSGSGLIITRDQVPFANLKTTDIGIQYAYRIDISEDLSFRPGIQVSWVSRSIDYTKIDFPAQYDDWGFQGGSTNENLSSDRISYANFAAGGLLYSPVFWFGFASHNLSRPNQSLLQGDSRLPVRTGFHAGYKIYLKEKARKRYGFKEDDDEISLTAAANYRMEGKSDQLDLGAYLNYHQLVFGLWYKGLPVKNYQPTILNHESVIGLIGLDLGNFRMGYSYDITVSRLAKANTAGAHEISLTYLFDLPSGGKKRCKPKNRRPVCPKF